MINKYTNKQRGLLAVIMAMVMVFAGAAFVAAEVDADPTEMTNSCFTGVKEDKTYTLTGDLIVRSAYTIPATVEKICNGEGKEFKIILIDDLSFAASSIIFENVFFQTVDDQAVDPTKHGQILVNAKNASFNGCSFIEYEGIDGVDGQYAVNVTSGTITATNTEFNNKKLTVTGNADVTLNKATNVYLNYGEGLDVEVVVSADQNDCSELVIGNETTIKTLTLRGTDSFDIGNIDFSVDTLKAKGANVPEVKSSGKGILYVNTIDVYEDDLSNVEFNDITLGSATIVKSNMSIGGNISLSSNAYMEFDENAKISATVESADGTEVQFTKITTPNKFKLSNGSLVIGGETTVSAGEIRVLKGTARVAADISTAMKVYVDSGATLVIPSGKTVGIVYNNGTVDLQGAISYGSNSGIIEVNGEAARLSFSGDNNSGTVILNSQPASLVVSNGTVALAAGVILPENVTSDKIKVVSAESLGDSFGMSKDLESDYTVKTSAFLANDLTIPEGVTLTIDGTLSLNGKKLFVEGTLAVGKKGTITDIGSGAIVLSKTGAIVNEGIVGKDSIVIVADKETGGKEVSMKNVIGLSFGLTKEIGIDGPTYTLTVSGEAAKKGDAPSLTITGAYVSNLVVKDVEVNMVGATVLKDGAVSLDSKGTINVDGVFTLKTGVTLDVDGIIKNFDANGNKVVMCNGTTVVINGSAQDVIIEANTGTIETYDDDGKRVIIDEINPDLSSTDNITSSSITLGNLNGITIEITSKSFTKEVNEEDVPYIEQMMNVYGTAAFADKEKNELGTAATGTVIPSGKITVVGNVYVPTGSELILGEDMDLDNDGIIITAGLMKTLKDAGNNYKGSKYVIEATTETGSPYEVFYYTNFDDAYAAIATADDMTIYIAGGYEFTKEYTIAAEQEIEFVSGDFKISKDGKVTVEADGTLSSGFLVADSDASPAVTAGIKGILIVMDDATCVPASGSYEVSSKDADNNMTYTSAELAIANAKAGETIYITDDVTFEDKTTIPEGVTVEIANSATVTAKDDLVVDGKLVNEGTIVVEATGDDEKADLIVKGEIDNTAGVVTVDGDATITGTFEGVLAASNINAAKYYDGEKYVYTNIASAVADCAEMDVIADVNVIGKVSESSDVVLAEGQKLTIDGEVVLKSVRLDVGSNLTVNGKLTADVIAATGVMDTTGALADSVVSVKEIEDVEFDVKKNDAKSTVTMYMDVIASGDMNGTTTVTAGSVQLDAAVEVDKDNVMKVSEDATLVVMENITAGSGNSKYFSNAGTLVINDDNVTLNGLNLGGTVDVVEKKALTVSNVTVSGTLTTGEDASVTVADGKYMYVGSKPATLGAAGTVNADVAFGNNAYIVVFEGSTFTNTDADIKMDSTAYTINDIAFATVYVAEGNSAVLVQIIDPIVLKLEDLRFDFNDTDGDGVKDDNEGYTINWKSGSTGANTAAVGQYDTVNAKIGYASVNVTISVGPGMLVYIDDIKDTDGKESLTIGTHTITVYIEKGYEGTPAITLNGQTITDGKLVITTDMMDLEQNLLSVTGATVMQDQPVVIQPSDSEKDGMELTDILLIVLVVLIVIMAIIVALRMMRS